MINILIVDVNEPPIVFKTLEKLGYKYKKERLTIKYKSCDLIAYFKGKKFWDCAEPELAEELIDKGYIPNLKKCEKCEQMEKVRTCDFTNTKRTFCVERARTDDLWSKMCGEGRIFLQFDKMDKWFKSKKFLIIEGTFKKQGSPAGLKANFNTNSDAMSPLQEICAMTDESKHKFIYTIIREAEMRNIHVIQTWNLEETCRFVHELDKGCGKKPRMRAHPKRIPKASVGVNMLACIPTIGIERAKAMVKEFGGIPNIIDYLRDEKMIAKTKERVTIKNLLEQFGHGN